MSNFPFRPFGIRVFEYHYRNRLGWVGLFGKGIKWKDIKLHPLLFSERNGHRGTVIKGWWIGFSRSL